MWHFLFHIYFRLILAIKTICHILSSFVFILEMSIADSLFNLINRKLGEQQINCISWQAWKWLFFILLIIECVICTLQKYYLNYMHWATIQPNISIKYNIFRMVLSNWSHKVENCYSKKQIPKAQWLKTKEVHFYSWNSLMQVFLICRHLLPHVVIQGSRFLLSSVYIIFQNMQDVLCI